jgi:hypothetical protein
MFKGKWHRQRCSQQLHGRDACKRLFCINLFKYIYEENISFIFSHF